MLRPNRKEFRCDKSFLGNLRMRVHSDQVMQGRLFCNFISLILATLFENRLRENRLLGKYSLAEALSRLSKVRRLVIPGRPSVDLEILKKSADILTACGITAVQPFQSIGAMWEKDSESLDVGF